MINATRISPRPTHTVRDPERGYQVRFNRHPQRKNNFKVAEMYDCYKDGMSLATIAKLYSCTRQAVYDVFQTRGYPLRAKKLRGETWVDGFRFTYAKNNHLRGTVGSRRISLHVYLWEKENGPVPAGYVVYHMDRDEFNNSPENLGLLGKHCMSHVLNPNGNNQHKKSI